MFNNTHMGDVIVRAMNMALAAPPMPLAPPRPGEGKRRKPTPAYVQKVPTTASDHERVRLADVKRGRKAGKLRAIAAAGGIATA